MDGDYWNFRQKNSVIERNYLKREGDMSKGGAGIASLTGTDGIIIRNNIVDNFNQTSVNMHGYSTLYKRGTNNIFVYNNTVVGKGITPGFAIIRDGGKNIHFQNNLFSSPDLKIDSGQAS